MSSRPRDIDNLVVQAFNNIFYRKKIDKRSGNTLEQDIFAAYIADDDEPHSDNKEFVNNLYASPIPDLKVGVLRTCKLIDKSFGINADGLMPKVLYPVCVNKMRYRQSVYSRFMKENNSTHRRSLVFRKPRTRKDPLRKLEPNNAAIMAGLLYKDMFRDRSLLDQLRHAHDEKDIKALLSIDVMLDSTRRSQAVRDVLKSDYCIESKALQIAKLVNKKTHLIQKRVRKRPPRQNTPAPPPRQRQPEHLPLYYQETTRASRPCGGIEMRDEIPTKRRSKAGRFLVGAIALAAFLAAGAETVRQVMEEKVVRHGDHVLVGTLFSSTSYPLDYLYFSKTGRCQPIRRALAQHVDKKAIQSIIEYNQMPDSKVCLGKMIRIPKEFVKNTEGTAGLVEGAVVPDLDRNHPLLFPDEYYQCRGENYITVSKRVSGRAKNTEKIKEYNRSHNPHFHKYKSKHRCYGRILIPPSIVKQKKWMRMHK